MQIGEFRRIVDAEDAVDALRLLRDLEEYRPG